MKRRHMIWQLALVLIFVMTAGPLSVSAQSEINSAGIVVTEDGISWRKVDRLGIFEETGDSIDKILAPGSKGTYEFAIKNTAAEPREIELMLEEENLHAIPVEIRVSADREYVYGSEGNWISADQADAWIHTIEAGKETRIELEWRWYSDQNSTEYDTYLGEKAVEEELYYKLAISIGAQEPKVIVSSNGGSGTEQMLQTKAGTVVKTGDTNVFWYYIALLAGAVLILVYCKTKKKQIGKKHKLYSMFLIAVIVLGVVGASAGTTSARYRKIIPANEDSARAALFKVKVEQLEEETSIDLYAMSKESMDFTVKNTGEVAANCRVEWSIEEETAVPEVEITDDAGNPCTDWFRLEAGEEKIITVTIYADPDVVDEDSTYGFNLELRAEQID